MIEYATPEQLATLTDDDMRRLGEKMGEAYTNEVFWIDAEILVKNILEEK